MGLYGLAWATMHTQSRVNKALPVLAALGELSDPQVALQLLRHCASFSKMVFSIRAVPASFHTEALLSFDAQVRACFEQFSSLRCILTRSSGSRPPWLLTMAAWVSDRSSSTAMPPSWLPAAAARSSAGSWTLPIPCSPRMGRTLPLSAWPWRLTTET